MEKYTLMNTTYRIDFWGINSVAEIYLGDSRTNTVYQLVDAPV